MRTMTRFAIFQKNKNKLAKAVKLEEMVFNLTRTTIVATKMTRRVYILEKFKVVKLSEALTTLK